MKLTNRYGLPKTLVNAIERDPYSMGNARISVTGLLRPPRITLLSKRHANQMESDVTDHIWSLMGRAVHQILELGGDEEHLTEERLFATVRGWRISGALDLQRMGNNVHIIDYKNCSVWAVVNEKPEWEYQLNMYRWLLETAKPDYKVSRLAICAFMRDWNRNEAKRDQEYPQSPATMVPIPLWPMEAAQKFVEERVRIHQEAQAAADMGDEPPDCTDEDRWMRQDKWRVAKPGAKRAYRIFDTQQAANDYLSKRGYEFRQEYRVSLMPGEPIRCTGDYCHVSAFCTQYAKWQMAKIK